MILVIGPTSSGKTLLFKKITSMCNLDENTVLKSMKKSNKVDVEEHREEPNVDITLTQPTVGTNIANFTIKRKKYTLHEVGGSMSPLWKSYFKDTSKLIYVIDASSPQMSSSALVNLLEVLSNEHIRNIPMLIVMNKIDSPSTCSPAEIKYMLHMNEIQENCLNISVVSCSAKFSTNLQSVIDWIK